MKTIIENRPKVEFQEHLPNAILANQVLHQPQQLSQLEYEQFISIKRDRAESDNELRGLLFVIGLCVSLLFAITAINWNFSDKTDLIDLGIIADDFETMTEIPISKQPPPPPPKIQVENLKIVEVNNETIVEELDLNIDVEITQDESITDIVFDDIPIEAEIEEADEIFQIVESQPTPIGGLSAFYTYVGENLDYPAAARRLDVSGVVYVRFVVEKDGTVTGATLIKGIGAGCDEEAIRVINNAPAWVPGKQRGKAVRVYMTVPIRFVLHER